MFSSKDYILNYPIANLKIQAERYYGYPKDVPEKMTSMVDSNFDWKNSKIAVVNDFGFQLIKYLLRVKSCELKNITMLLTDVGCCENLEAEFSFTGLNFDYIDLETKEMKNNFDLIIANPPYGKNSSLVQKIVIELLDRTRQLVLLSPKSTFRNEICRKAIKSVQEIKNCFQDAAIAKLTIAVLSKNTENSITLEDICFTESQKKLSETIKSYNVKHPIQYIFIPLQINTKKKLSERVLAFAKSAIEENLKVVKMSCKEALEKHCMFLVTVRSPLNGVHVSYSHDHTYNLEGKWKEEWENGSPMNALFFSNSRKVEHFKDWWYSCLSREKDKKLRSGLTNACLDLCRDGDGKDMYYKYFPNVDWSRSWTDEEILEEIGLPRDFLETASN